MGALVVAVSRLGVHSPSKEIVPAIRLVAGHGVAGDAHAGTTVQHRSRVARDPSQPNVRQVHLIHEELLDELRDAGFTLAPGEMGENVTTRGIDLLGLPEGTRLELGGSAVVVVTGLRNPCVQLDGLRPGLMAANREVTTGPDGEITVRRKAGVMGIVAAGGEVRAGDAIGVVLPAPPHRPLVPV